jgi:hypothetical protein
MYEQCVPRPKSVAYDCGCGCGIPLGVRTLVTDDAGPEPEPHLPNLYNPVPTMSAFRCAMIQTDSLAPALRHICAAIMITP